ncbi:hypothetical protein V5E97_37080 [Singulisphaera sp. Ch08]|uniref:Uncharacterized protein n=1 Tax=Singulisphaera sp. Ch08 TaxID=3120278 RepID=A0AAU7CG17_9BACT
MRMPRVRFREFLLITTLASLVTAAFALRASVAHLEAAHVHATRAYQARLQLPFWEGVVKDRQMRVKRATTAAEKAILQVVLTDARSLQVQAVENAEHLERVASRYRP